MGVFRAHMLLRVIHATVYLSVCLSVCMSFYLSVLCCYTPSFIMSRRRLKELLVTYGRCLSPLPLTLLMRRFGRRRQGVCLKNCFANLPTPPLDFGLLKASFSSLAAWCLNWNRLCMALRPTLWLCFVILAQANASTFWPLPWGKNVGLGLALRLRGRSRGRGQTFDLEAETRKSRLRP